MDLDIKNLEDQDMRGLVKSLELVSARVLDSVIRAGQLAAVSTPEVQLLFSQWVDCIGAAVTDAVERDGSIDPEKLAAEIGVTPATVIALALTLHRSGSIKITSLKAEKGTGSNTEICGCLK